MVARQIPQVIHGQRQALRVEQDIDEGHLIRVRITMRHVVPQQEHIAGLNLVFLPVRDMPATTGQDDDKFVERVAMNGAGLVIVNPQAGQRK